MKDVYDKFGLEDGTKDFIGHAMALYLDDAYASTKGSAPEAIERIRLYGNSVARYGKSPYIYPLYGLGELPQGFARLSAIYGGTYMLNTSVDEVLYEGGAAVGIKATMSGIEPEMKFETKAKMILGDPSYFPNKVKVTGHVLRAICVLKHPLAGTNDADSAQLIIPQSQVGRKNGQSLQKPRDLHPFTDLGQTSTLPACLPHTMSAPRATGLPSSQPSPRHLQTTTWSSSPVWSASARSRSSSWELPSPCTSPWTTAPRTRSSSPRATTPRATSRPQPMTSRTSTAGARVRSSRWKACGRVSRSLRSKGSNRKPSGVEGKMGLKLFGKARYRSKSFLVVRGHISDTMIPCKKQPTNERSFFFLEHYVFDKLPGPM